MTDQTTTDRDTPSRRAGLRDEIAAALEAADYRMDMRRGDLADAVLPVLHREWPWLRAEAEDATDRAAAPIDWVDGHPQLEAVAAAVWERCEHSDSGLIIDDPRNIAGAALAAVLPAPDQRAAVWLDAATRLWHQTNGLTEYGRGARWAIGELRRLAGEAQQAPCGRPASMATTPCSAGDHCCEGPSEAQQDPTQDGPRRGDQFEQWLKAQRDAHRDTGHGVWSVLDNLIDTYRQHTDTEPATDETQQGPTQDGEARPPQHAWRVETRDPLANEWAPGSHFASRPHAVERYETANRRAPLWRDGTPVERRIVRETTTYTVEDTTAPARSGQPETELRCVCGDPIQLQDDTDPTSWIHSPGSDTPCLHAHPSR